MPVCACSALVLTAPAKAATAGQLGEVDRPVDWAIPTACSLEACSTRVLGVLKADINLVPPNVPERTIHCDARAEGVLL
jgi:hypothetical protein